MSFNLIEIASIVVFFIGFFGLITSRNIIKSIVSLSISEIAVVVFFLNLGFESGMTPPFGSDMTNAADPLPQALVITAIILGVAVTAINLTMLISLGKKHQATDWDTINEEIAE